MIKVLARSIREYKKASILTPLLVTVEVILECAIPFVIANLVNQMQAGCTMDVIIRYGIALIAMSVVSLIFGAAAGVERAEAHVDGVRAALYGGLKRLARAGGREKLHRCLLHHLRFCWWPCWFCALKSWRLRSEISSR